MFPFSPKYSPRWIPKSTGGEGDFWAFNFLSVLKLTSYACVETNSFVPVFSGYIAAISSTKSAIIALLETIERFFVVTAFATDAEIGKIAPPPP